MLDEAIALMKSLGASFGFDPQPDAAGACGLRIDEKLDVTLRYEPTPPALLLYAPIGELPEPAPAGVLRRLLEENHVWERTRGATWSLSGDTVILSRLLSLPGLEPEPLFAEFGTFVNVALEGQRKLETPRGPASIAAAPMYGMLPSGVPVA
jgi:hypothetical protein